MKKKEFSKEELNAIKIIAKNSGSIEEAQATLRGLIGPVIQGMMESEMEEYLGYAKHSVKGNNSGNNRNGTYKKKILTGSGYEEIEVPRDRKGEYEPQILPKYETKSK